MWIDKAQTWVMAEALGGQALVELIIEDTHTCYHGDRSMRHAWGYSVRSGCAWVTGGTSTDRAETLSHDDRVVVMVPVCLDMARTDPARAEKLAAIRAASAYQRRDALMDAGWATMPGTDAPDRDIAQACLAELDL